jgi:Rod binding domain-containing protein
MESLASLSQPLTPLTSDPQLLTAQAKSGDPRSIDAVANSFESMFMSEILKEMRQTLDHGGFFGQDNSDIYGGLFDLFLGQHLAQSGGLGIAAMIKRQLEMNKKP